jgi:hypothetical protein
MKILNLKDLKNYCDLLPELTLNQLKKQFIFVSYCQNSIPGDGSPTYKSSLLKQKTIKNVIKLILHKDKKVTAITNKGYFQFFN